MGYEKVQQGINNIVGDNVKKLAQLFPSAIKDGEVDFEALKEELGQFSEAGSEKYELTWAGKKNAKKIAQEDIIGKTLKYIPEDSKDTATTKNLYIEGDNLEVLKLLRQNYYGAIKMIYIDPPYNTGNDFVYNDNFTVSEKKSSFEEGNANISGERYTINSKSSNRFHARWLDNIYPRLKIAKDLLTEDGAIFISIDDNEVHNLKKVCDEIFGEEGFVGQLSIVNNLKGRNDKKNIATCHEYLLIYGKALFESNGLPLTEEQRNKFDKEDENGNKYQLRDLRKRGRPDRREDRPNMYFPIYYNELTKECFLERQENTIEILPLRGDGSDGRWRWGKERVKANLAILEPRYSNIAGRWGIEHRVYLNPAMNPINSDDEEEDGDIEERSSKAKSVWQGGELSTDVGRRTFKEIMGNAAFDYPKPVDYLTKLVYMGTSDSDIVMDFFSGSASMAHAVMIVNSIENTRRKFVMIQWPEECDEKTEAYNLGFKNICEIGKERIRRAGEKIREDNPNSSIDIGFKLFKMADTNIKWNSILDMGQLDITQLETTPDLADFMPNTNDIDIVYELMLRQRDVSLSETLENLEGIGERTYLYASSYLVCLETFITEEIVDKLAAIDPLPIKFIFRDSAFKDDISLKDETFRRLKALIEKNSGTTKLSYTVEFI
ncbi:site-specific DNA-methyltransferase [Anaerocolumna sp. AGMB13020]|uniref:site-specific DNA-methyltransferase n=1 Tax=Anaerocolumna sp. AGMB13020 TaxID=3081750 RepID=UPI00295498CA|nr:site-specific DNA-methyltransferase [Anaerocolumna sp. AGMB13020]WOO38600.1 site-specific DNA-methyltransferase [Anaerocolumna sp. AGMB13020]